MFVSPVAPTPIRGKKRTFAIASPSQNGTFPFVFNKGVQSRFCHALDSDWEGRRSEARDVPTTIFENRINAALGTRPRFWPQGAASRPLSLAKIRHYQTNLELRLRTKFRNCQTNLE